MGESMVHRSGSSIVTYNTSPNISLEATNYKVAKSDASDLLHIPLYGNWEDVTAPDIEIYPDATFRVQEQYPISLLMKQDPEIFQKIRSKIAIERDACARLKKYSLHCRLKIKKFKPFSRPTQKPPSWGGFWFAHSLTLLLCFYLRTIRRALLAASSARLVTRLTRAVFATTAFIFTHNIHC